MRYKFFFVIMMCSVQAYPSYAMQGPAREGDFASIPRTVGRNFKKETEQYVEQLSEEARRKLLDLVRKDLAEQARAQTAGPRPPASVVPDSTTHAEAH